MLQNLPAILHGLCMPMRALESILPKCFKWKSRVSLYHLERVISGVDSQIESCYQRLCQDACCEC